MSHTKQCKKVSIGKKFWCRDALWLFSLKYSKTSVFFTIDIEKEKCVAHSDLIIFDS